MSERSVVRRSIAIAVGIVCILLIASLGGILAYYVPIVSEKDKSMSSLNHAYNEYVRSHSYNNSDYIALEDKLGEINSVLNLTERVIWEEGSVNQPAGSYTNLTESANYAGYVVVGGSSTSNYTYVRVIYSSHGVNYDNQISIGSFGVARFPILPSPNIEIRVGNTENVTSPYGVSETENILIIYYY
jgi:hypothetical protein